MKAHLQTLSNTRERIMNRISHSKPPSDAKPVTKSPAEEFEESTADLTSAATSYQFSLQTPQSTSKPKVQRPVDRSDRADCYQSVVSDITYQEQDFSGSSARYSSSSHHSNSFRSPLPSAYSSASPYQHHHHHSAEQTPRVGNVSNRYLQRSPGSRPPQYKQARRASMESAVSELTWNEPIMSQVSQDPPKSPPPSNNTSSFLFMSESSPPLNTTSVLERLGRKQNVSEAEYFASTEGGYSSTYQTKQPHQMRRQSSDDDSVSSIVSEITWVDLENSTSGPMRRSSFAAAASPAEADGLHRKNFHDSGGVSELTYNEYESESSLRISDLVLSDLMRSSIKEGANENSGSPSNSSGSNNLGASSSSKESRTKLEVSSSPESANHKSLAVQEEKIRSTVLRTDVDSMPRKPRRKMSTDTDEAFVFSSSDDDDYTIGTMSECSIKLAERKTQPKYEYRHHSSAEPSMESPAVDIQETTQVKEVASAVDKTITQSKKKRVSKTKTDTKSKSSKPKKNKKKKAKEDSSSEPSKEAVSDSVVRKPRTKKGKKKKSKDSDRSKSDDSELIDSTKLKKDPSKKKKKKKKLEDSERTNYSEDTIKSKKVDETRHFNDSDDTLKTKITKLSDSNRSLVSGSDRTNYSSSSTFDLDQLPELEAIGVPKTQQRNQHGELDADDDSSRHSMQSCLTIETATLSVPKPSAQTEQPARPAFRPKASTDPKPKQKSVMFLDGEPSRPPVPIAKKEVSRDWGEASIDRLPSMSLPNMPPRRTSQTRRNSLELIARTTHPCASDILRTSSHSTGPSEGVNFLLDRLSVIDDHDSAPMMPQHRRPSSDSFKASSPDPIHKPLSPETRASGSISTPKLNARDKLGLKPVPGDAGLVKPTSRVVGKQAMEKRRNASSLRKGEVFEAMHKMMTEED